MANQASTMEPINIEIGQVTRVSPTERDHIYAEGTVVLRNVSWNFNVHFHLWSDGEWHIGQENALAWHQKQALYTSRTDALNANPISDSAFRKLAEILTTFINSWVLDNFHEIQNAEIEFQRKAIEYRHKQIAEHKKAIEFLEKQIQSGSRLDMYPRIENYQFREKP